MATYFGEIVEKSSRAFWDDDFDSEDEMELERNEKPVGQLELVQSSSSGTIKCKLFFVIHGPLTEGFAEAYLINKGECVAEIKETDSENEDNTSGKKRKKPTTIYRISDEVLLCICSPYVDITNAFEFTEKLSTWMKTAEQVIVLTCNYFSEYYVTKFQNDQDTFLRALKTNCYNNPVFSDMLEQPNTLKGIPAGILTWCEMSKVAAVVYVCFAHSFEVDSRSVNLFSEIVSKLPFRLLKDKPNFTCRYSGPEVASNLYM